MLHPTILALFSCLTSPSLKTSLSSSTTSITSSSSCSFWHSQDQIEKLEDPPSPKYLAKIQEEPWRGGLEPIATSGIPLHSAKVVEGSIPLDLQGMLCRNGPGRTRIGDSQYGHWFDSDGLVSQLILDGPSQTATFMAKYVKTERFCKQQQFQKKRQDLQKSRNSITTTTTNLLGKVPMATASAWTKRGHGKWWENLFAIPTNPSNTNVLFIPKDDTSESDSSLSSSSSSSPSRHTKPRLYALAEGGDPVELDAQTLETLSIGPFTSRDGVTKAQSFFSAHYKKDPNTGLIYNHGVQLFPKPAMNIMKLSPTGELKSQKITDLPLLAFCHDTAMSEHYLVALIQPYAAPSSSLWTSILGGEPLGSQLRWSPEQFMSETRAMIFSKDSLECVAQVSLPILSTYHMLDAFDFATNDNGSTNAMLNFRTLVHDPPSCREELEDGFKDLYSHTKLPLCHIMEYTLDLDRQVLKSHQRVAPDAAPCELPDVHGAWQNSLGGHPKPRRFVWTNCRTETAGFLNGLQKIDLEAGKCSEIITLGESVFAGNPIFVSKPNAENEDDGYILSQLYRSDEHRSDVCILDAATMKVLTMLQLQSHITYQFHGEWFPGKF